jgi:hypothetical protein
MLTRSRRFGAGWPAFPAKVMRDALPVAYSARVAALRPPGRGQFDSQRLATF